MRRRLGLFPLALALGAGCGPLGVPCKGPTCLETPRMYGATGVVASDGTLHLHGGADSAVCTRAWDAAAPDRIRCEPFVFGRSLDPSTGGSRT